MNKTEKTEEQMGHISREVNELPEFEQVNEKYLLIMAQQCNRIWRDMLTVCVFRRNRKRVYFYECETEQDAEALKQQCGQKARSYRIPKRYT